MIESQGEVRIDTVASSASTTAKVAAVIQRGGSFLSGSFTGMAWAEDGAGRSTVCLTRSMSYTSLVSPLEMEGLFGMAQVIGAKTLGVVLVTDRYNHWDAPTLDASDQQHGQMVPEHLTTLDGNSIGNRLSNQVVR